MSSTQACYGLVAEFDDPDSLLAASDAARRAGYTAMDAYTPFPVHGLTEVLRADDPRVPWTVFVGGLVGAVAGYGLQYFVSVIDYPLNVGGRPFHSWPSFIPVTFEATVLLAAFGAVFGMFALNGLPQPHHPIFGARNFDRASTDGFFLCIEAGDPIYERRRTAEFLEGLRPKAVSEVPQ